MAGIETLERPFKSSVASLLRRLVGARPGAFPEHRTVRAILVIRQHNQLGDMLCVVPLLRALRTQFPSARIALLASPGNRDIMDHHPCLDEVITYDKTEFLRGAAPRPGNLLRYVRELRRHSFDLAVVPSTVSVSFTSDALAYLSGAPVRVGASSLSGTPNPSAFFFNLRRDLDWSEEPRRHQTLRNWDILGPWIGPPASLAHEMGLLDSERASGRAFVEKTRRGHSTLIAYHPGAGKAPNRWAAGRFAEVANALAGEFDAMTFVTEGPMDADEVRAMESALSASAQVIRNQPVRSVASILSHMDLVVSNDTGIMHVAAAAGVPVLSLFGPTDPEQWAPTGAHHRYIQGEGGRIDRIPVEDVLRLAREMLGPLRGRNGSSHAT
jgi:heptosyltransferase-2